jgi:hypothetical protein
MPGIQLFSWPIRSLHPGLNMVSNHICWINRFNSTYVYLFFILMGYIKSMNECVSDVLPVSVK